MDKATLDKQQPWRVTGYTERNDSASQPSVPVQTCCGQPLNCGYTGSCVPRDEIRAKRDATFADGTRLTTDSTERKATPIATGVLDYFPLAMAAIARLSKKGNDKHNPGEPLHWAREKSTDHADCIARHLIERDTIEPESGESHKTCLAWRALALLEIAEEKRLGIAPPGV